MCIYTYIDIFFFILILLEIYHPSKAKSCRLFNIAGFIVFFILAFRGTHVGGDIEDYLGYYTGKDGIYGTLNHPNPSIEIGFNIFSRLLHLISGDEIFYLFVISCITILPFLYLIYKESSIKIIPLFLYMTQWHMIGISQTAFRQCLAISLIMFGYFIYKRYFFKGLGKKYRIAVITFLAIISVTCHSTMLLTFPLIIFLHFIKFNKKWVVTLLFSSVLITVVFQHLFPSLYDGFYTLFKGVDLVDNMTRYYNSSYYELQSAANKISPIKLISACVISIYTYFSTKKEIQSLTFKMLIVACLIYNVGTQFVIIQRFVFSLALFGVTFVPSHMFLYRNNDEIIKQLFRLFVIVALLWFIRVDVGHYNDDYENVYIDAQMLPYNFWFEEK